MPNRLEKLESIRRAVFDESLPAAFVDWDRLNENCKLILKTAAGIPVRLATKSIRSIAIIQAILQEHEGFKGLMAYSPREAVFLSENGLDNILIAYPSYERKDIGLVIERLKIGAKIIFMIDSISHAETLSEAASECGISLEVCIDIDMSIALPGLFFGVKRSPLRNPEDINRLADVLVSKKNLNVIGIMGYEAQIAGVPDRHPTKKFQNIIVTLLKKMTFKQVVKKRKIALEILREKGFVISLINGGGTGSLSQSKSDASLTELTAGSGIYAPRLFDFYQDLHLEPAAGFALRVTRKPDSKTVTCHGGGYAASGAAGVDRLPQPYFPAGLRLTSLEGAGEVQTPLIGEVHGITTGDTVLFRHAKAGELCEYFSELLCIQGDKIIRRVKTYRGDGKVF